jgi:hypothetical protein
VNKYQKPLPEITAVERPFWDATSRHELRLQKCLSCEHVWFPTYANCPQCLGAKYEWALMSGRGKVWSWVIFHRSYFRSYDLDVPYNVAYIELEEGPKIMSNIVGIPDQEIVIDMPVKVVFDDVSEGITLPRFTPA